MSVAGGADRGIPRAAKAATAFRTISEVAQELEVPQHVLRFWESKFTQVKPLKRGGGRRYYRPEDVVLLRRIRQCLYQDGYTIKGVQRLLREGTLRGPAPVLLAAVPAPAAAPSPAQVAPLRPVSALLPPSVETEMRELRRALGDILRELDEMRTLLRRRSE